MKLNERLLITNIFTADYGFSAGGFGHHQKPLAEYVPVIQTRSQLTQYPGDFGTSADPLQLLDKPRAGKEHVLYNPSPASCHSPRNHGEKPIRAIWTSV